MTIFRVRSTNLGADRPYEIYFASEKAAKEHLDTRTNGEIEEMTLIGMGNLPYDGCTWSDIGYWGGDVRRKRKR